MEYKPRNLHEGSMERPVRLCRQSLSAMRGDAVWSIRLGRPLANGTASSLGRAGYGLF